MKKFIDILRITGVLCLILAIVTLFTGNHDISTYSIAVALFLFAIIFVTGITNYYHEYTLRRRSQ